MTGRQRIGPAIERPTAQAMRETQQQYQALAKVLQRHARGHEGFKRTYKAVAHALLYRTQFHGIPTAELLELLRSLLSFYLPKGSKLGMHDDLRTKLENTAGLPQWPDEPERKAINAALADLYRETNSLPVALQVRMYWHILMVNAENLGMTHEAVFRRLEVLDRFQRAEGAPQRYIPSEPPAWVRHMQEQKR